MTSINSFGGDGFPLSDAEVRNIVENDDFDDAETYDVLYDYYTRNGLMPYGTAKARDGDPHQWIFDQLCERVGL